MVRAAHALGRRIGRAQLGMLGLERLQALEQLVVLGVRQLGRVEHVVEVGVAAQLLAQCGGFASRVFARGHAGLEDSQLNRRRASGEPAERSRESSVS